MQVMEGIVPFFPYGDREAALQTLAGILERGPSRFLRKRIMADNLGRR
ncbi:hypothetical protein LQV63_31155 [Paenibacillus profundus]|uniref:Uncharacterized protein n=1 Tax=Paenibacillus profundus TaxID=1173085 RepID=A0ABS8YPE4_9BACL|nr:hypothetical protein [Paenibacillus profundus]